MINMAIEIISEKDNPLRKRKEYWLLLNHVGKETPSRHDALPEIAKKLGSKEDFTLIDKIFTERGSAKSKIKVMVYSDKKEIPAEKLERHSRKVKSFLEKKQAAAPAAAVLRLVSFPPSRSTASGSPVCWLNSNIIPWLDDMPSAVFP